MLVDVEACVGLLVTATAVTKRKSPYAAFRKSPFVQESALSTHSSNADASIALRTVHFQSGLESLNDQVT